MSLALVCHSAGAILLWLQAWGSTDLMIARFKLDQALAVVFTVLLGFLAAGAISFLSVMISIPLARVR